MTITLPWPPSTLSPNARLHWSAAARAKKSYRLACWACAKEQGAKAHSGPLTLRLDFYPPDRRSYDHDNLLARMKAGLDGLADAMKIDDKNFRPSVHVMPDIGGMVKIHIAEMACSDDRS